jgi:hypothetical protein
VQLITNIAVGLSSASFGGYGVSCLCSRAMVVEFERFRLARYRVLTGTLQVAASVGLLVGLMIGARGRALLLVCAGGLAVMMLLALLVRVRINDPVLAAVPAFLFFVLNAYIAVSAMQDW